MRLIAIPASPPSASGSRTVSAPKALATSRLDWGNPYYPVSPCYVGHLYGHQADRA